MFCAYQSVGRGQQQLGPQGQSLGVVCLSLSDELGSQAGQTNSRQNMVGWRCRPRSTGDSEVWWWSCSGRSKSPVLHIHFAAPCRTLSPVCSGSCAVPRRALGSLFRCWIGAVVFDVSRGSMGGRGAVGPLELLGGGFRAVSTLCGIAVFAEMLLSAGTNPF